MTKTNKKRSRRRSNRWTSANESSPSLSEGKGRKNIKSTTNLILYKNDKFQLQVISWGRGKPQLAKQELYDDGSGLKAGKIKGLTLSDLEIVKSNWNEVKAALNGKVIGVLDEDHDDNDDDQDDSVNDEPDVDVTENIDTKSNSEDESDYYDYDE